MSATAALLARIRAAAALAAPGLGVDESIDLAPPTTVGERAFRYRHDQDRASLFHGAPPRPPRQAAQGSHPGFETGSQTLRTTG